MPNLRSTAFAHWEFPLSERRFQPRNSPRPMPNLELGALRGGFGMGVGGRIKLCQL